MRSQKNRKSGTYGVGRDNTLLELGMWLTLPQALQNYADTCGLRETTSGGIERKTIPSADISRFIFPATL
ncbi:hypothetical protein OKW28_005298 [Paraburkholderia sp. 40]